MKAQKVVKIEIFQAECGNTVVAVVFGIEGGKAACVGGALGYPYSDTRRMFTETNRVEMGWHEGYALRHFNGWSVPAPTVHPAETVVDAVEAAMMAAAGWDQQEEDRTPIPRMAGGVRSRGRLALAA